MKSDDINQEAELLLIGEEDGAQQLTQWPLNNRIADVHEYASKLAQLEWPQQLYQ